MTIEELSKCSSENFDLEKNLIYFKMNFIFFLNS